MQETNNTNEGSKLIEIYSTPSCHFCHMAKDWFTEIGAKYVDYDVASDASKRAEMLEITGQMGVPVIKIGNDVVIGFNQAKLEELLKA
jgi:glutaredoxin-like YruB-family protein